MKNTREVPVAYNADYRQWNMALISCFSVDDLIWAK